MTFTKKGVIISVFLALVIISCIIFVPAVLTAKNEDNAAAELGKIYNDEFVVTKSTAGAFTKEFTVTVQSEKTKIVYDFDVNNGEYTGEYYAENVNAKVNELVESIVGEENLAMSNVYQQGLQQEITLDEANVEKADVHIIVLNPISNETAQQVADALKAQFGDIPVALETYVVKEERVFEGVKLEVGEFFQLSQINGESFVDFEFETQTFNF